MSTSRPLRARKIDNFAKFFPCGTIPWVLKRERTMNGNTEYCIIHIILLGLITAVAGIGTIVFPIV
jgi:hypothetical protein